MKKLLLASTLLFTMTGLAHAQWRSSVEDDLFSGKNAILIGDMSAGEAMYFDCKKGQEPRLALLLPYKDGDDDISVQVDMLVKVDDNTPLKGIGTFEKRNDNYMQISYSGDNIPEMLKQLRDAKNQYLAGFQVERANIRESFRGSVYRSTASINRFVDACDISLPE